MCDADLMANDEKTVREEIAAVAEVTAAEIVDQMRNLQGTWLLTDDDHNTLNNAAHILYRIAARASGRT
jgi:hypothetical protein